MSWRYILANLAAGNQPLSILDQMFNDTGNLTTIQCAASGTNAITLTENSFTPPVSAYANLLKFSFFATATSTGAVTIQLGALAALPLYIDSYVANGLRQAAAGDIINTTFYEIVYLASLNSGNGGFIIMSSKQMTEAGVSTSISGGVCTLKTADNVSSVTYNGVGDYTVNFQVALANANYLATFGCQGVGGQQIVIYEDATTPTRTTTALRVAAVNVSGPARADPQILSVHVKL